MEEKYSTWEFACISVVISSLIFRYYGTEFRDIPNARLFYYIILVVAIVFCIIWRIEKKLTTVYAVSIFPAALITIYTKKLAILALSVLVIGITVCWLKRLSKVKKHRIIRKITEESFYSILKGIIAIAYVVATFNSFDGLEIIKHGNSFNPEVCNYVQEDSESEYKFSYDSYFDYLDQYSILNEFEKRNGLNNILENEIHHLGITGSTPQIEFVSYEMNDGYVTYGDYNWGSNVISINQILLAENNPETIIKVLLHETCHFYQKELLEDLEEVDLSLEFFQILENLNMKLITIRVQKIAHMKSMPLNT